MSPKGIQVVEVEGILNDGDIRNKILNEKWDIKEICSMLPSVSKFLDAYRYDIGVDDFHEACSGSYGKSDVTDKNGFADAAKEYKTANMEHFNAEVVIKTQFLMFVNKIKPIYPDVMTESFVAGFSGVTLSSGPLAGQELYYSNLIKLIQED